MKLDEQPNIEHIIKVEDEAKEIDIKFSRNEHRLDEIFGREKEEQLQRFSSNLSKLYDPRGKDRPKSYNPWFEAVEAIEAMKFGPIIIEPSKLVIKEEPKKISWWIRLWKLILPV